MIILGTNRKAMKMDEWVERHSEAKINAHRYLQLLL